MFEIFKRLWHVVVLRDAGKARAVHTWSNSDGQRYSTCNPKANPNGVLPGNWTEETPAPPKAKPQ